jgi:Ca-activated chloride channel family protein
MTVLVFSLFSIALIGCSGSGGSDEPTGSTTPTTPTAAEISVIPENFNFGIVTGANSVESLDVTIQNNGTKSLTLTDITLSDAVNFALDLDAGASPCRSNTPTIAADANCTVNVDFVPQDVTIPAEGIDYDAVLTISSDDPTTPEVEVGLTGKRQNVTEITVKINQIDAPCPRVAGTPVTAYISVMDQGGFPVTSLGAAEFALTEEGTSQSVDTTFISSDNDNPVTISIALLMDYSGSITDESDNVNDMENAALSFISQLGDNDEAEVIKYAREIEIAQSFTNDKTLLSEAITSTPNTDGPTRLYDAIERAIDDLSQPERTKDRSAIVIITDGIDNDGSGNPLSDSTLEDVIAGATANGIPVFTVGLGESVNEDLLQQIADDTGGTFSSSATSDNLTTIYLQLASLLFTDQYVLTYNTGLDGSQAATLSVTATYAPGISSSNTKEILACE